MTFKKSVVLIGTPGNFSTLLAKKQYAAFNVAYHSVILDKLDLLQAMDFKEEIVEVANVLKEAQVSGKVIFTTNVRDEKDLSIEEQDDFKTIKAALMGTEKALIVRMNDDADDKDRTAFESIAHLFAFAKTVLDKYILTFNLIKLAIFEGKTVIMVNDVTQAYRMKYFLAKFSLRSFVLSTDMPKAQISSILHFFNIGQFDLLIMLQKGYSKRPMIKDITNILNFDMPADYNTYKQNGLTITEETGCVLSLVSPEKEEDIAALGLI